MIVRIYQIQFYLDRRRVCFMPYDYILRQYDGVFPSDIYQMVYQIEGDADDPEEIFRRFNLFLPEDYSARSLSVSDIVEFERSTNDRLFYICEPIGFREICFDYNQVFDPSQSCDQTTRQNGEAL